MNRTPLLVGALFVAVVGAGAIWLGPRLWKRPLRTSSPREGRPSGDPVAPRPDDTPPRRAPAPDSATGPASAAPSAPWRAPKLEVTTPEGAPLSEAHAFAGAPDPRGFPGSFVDATGFALTPIPPTGPDGVVRVRLQARAPDLVVTVREADGRPASGLPVGFGVEGAFETTDAEGHARIASMPAGVLRLDVGMRARVASAVRVRMGVDRAAEAVLQPAWGITVHTVDEAGRPVAADVDAVGFDGSRTVPPTKRTGSGIADRSDGVTRLVTRVDERLAIVASAPGYESTTVRAPVPDPRAPLTSELTVRLRKARERLEGTLAASPDLQRDLTLRAEPAVSAIVRERFGREDAAELAISPVRAESNARRDEVRFEFPALDPGVPWRFLVRGPLLLAEDHVLALDEPPLRRLELRPEPRASGARPATEPAPATNATSLRGRITDVRGAPLPGVTVSTEGLRATTDADGQFVLPGVPKGRALDVVYGWADGADCGKAVPSEFAPWFRVSVAASDDLLALTLPKASAVRFRLTDGMTGKPLSWARVVILDGERSVRFDAAVATVDGQVSLEGLLPGTTGSLFAFAPGLRREVPLALRAGETTDAGEVGLVRGGRVTGTVTDRAGAAIAGASVAVMEDGRLEREGRASVYGRDLGMRHTRTDGSGAFVLEGLDTSRPAAIGVAADGFAPTARRVLWTEGEVATLRVALSRGGGVRLRLLDPEGGRVSGAFIELEDARTGVRWTDLLRRAAFGSFVASAEDVRRATAGLLLEDPASPGVYRIGPVESGPYDVLVTCPGFRSQRAKLTVPDAEPGSKALIPTAGLDWRLELSRSDDGR